MHHSTQLLLPFDLNLTDACLSGHLITSGVFQGIVAHLVDNELLVLKQPLSALIIGDALLLFLLLDPLLHHVHVAFIRLVIEILALALFAHLLGKHFVNLFLLMTILLLQSDVLLMGEFILLQALLDVFLLLLQLKLLAVVLYHVCHVVHQPLDAVTSLLLLLFALLLPLQSHSHIFFDLRRLSLL